MLLHCERYRHSYQQSAEHREEDSHRRFRLSLKMESKSITAEQNYPGDNQAFASRMVSGNNHSVHGLAPTMARFNVAAERRRA
jgi:hypothetical protein